MFCRKCGKRLVENAAICPDCHTPTSRVGQTTQQTGYIAPTYNYIASKIFMVLGCILSGLTIIPLFWCIPMTAHLFDCAKRGITPGTGFKVCSMLFVSFLGGIFMFFDI